MKNKEIVYSIRIEGFHSLDYLEKLVSLARSKNATEFDLRITTVNGIPFVEEIEFYRVKSEREILTEERDMLQKKICKLNDKLLNLPPNPIPDHEVAGGESD